MSELKIGDKIEINYHRERENIGQKGLIIFAGQSLKEGTQPSDFRSLDVDDKFRYIVLLDNGMLLSDLREVQLRKI